MLKKNEWFTNLVELDSNRNPLSICLQPFRYGVGQDLKEKRKKKISIFSVFVSLFHKFNVCVEKKERLTNLVEFLWQPRFESVQFRFRAGQDLKEKKKKKLVFLLLFSSSSSSSASPLPCFPCFLRLLLEF